MARNRITREMLLEENKILRGLNAALRQAAVSAAAMLQDAKLGGPLVRAVIEVVTGIDAGPAKSPIAKAESKKEVQE